MKNKKIQKNKYGISKNFIQKFGFFQSQKKGFIILIAIVVSSLAISVGLFISNTAYKELVLSSSTQNSQKAFYMADSVMECALRADIVDNIFDDASNGAGANQINFSCNYTDFKGELSSTYGGSEKTEYSCKSDPVGTTDKNCYNGKFVYFVSFSSNYLDGDGNVNNPVSENIKKSPFAKVIFEKKFIGDLGYTSDQNINICPEDNPRCKDKTTIQVFGKNKYSGNGVVERALEVNL